MPSNVPVWTSSLPGMTFECWFNLPSTDASDYVWFLITLKAIQIDGGRFARDFIFGGGSAILNMNLFMNGWRHLAITWSNLGASVDRNVYLDGALVQSLSLSAPPPSLAVASSTLFGFVADFRVLEGSMDEFALYYRALSSAEVAAHYSAASTNIQQGVSQVKCIVTVTNTGSENISAPIAVEQTWEPASALSFANATPAHNASSSGAVGWTNVQLTHAENVLAAGNSLQLCSVFTIEAIGVPVNLTASVDIVGSAVYETTSCSVVVPGTLPPTSSPTVSPSLSPSSAPSPSPTISDDTCDSNACPDLLDDADAFCDYNTTLMCETMYGAITTGLGCATGNNVAGGCACCQRKNALCSFDECEHDHGWPAHCAPVGGACEAHPPTPMAPLGFVGSGDGCAKGADSPVDCECCVPKTTSAPTASPSMAPTPAA